MTYTDKEIIGHIQRLADDGKPPTATKFNNDSVAPNHATARRHFGSWAEAVEAADYEPRARGPAKVDGEEIIEHIQRLADDGKPPTATKFNNDSVAPSHVTAADRFGSWSEAVEAAGYEPRAGGPPKVDAEEVVEHIQRLADGAKPPTAQEFKNNSAAPSDTTAADRFGSWAEAVEAAGYEPLPRGRPKSRRRGQS